MFGTVTDRAVNLTAQQFGAFALVLLASWVALWWVTFRLRKQEHDEAEARELALEAKLEAEYKRGREQSERIIAWGERLAPVLDRALPILERATHALDREGR